MRKNIKKSISIFMIILMFGLVITGCTEKKPDTLTQAQKIEDFEYMYKIIEENYPFLEVNKRVNGVDWLGKKDEFMEEIKKCKNDEEFFSKLNDILLQLNNGHTHMVDKDYFQRLFSVYSNNELFTPWIEELSKPQALKRYKYNPNKIEQSEDVAQYVTKDNIKSKIIDDNIAYLKIKSFNSYNIESEKEIIKKFINEIKNIDGLIIDIRGNPGGASKYWAANIIQPLIEKELKTDFYYFSRGIGFTDKFMKNISTGCGRYQIEDFENLKKMKELPPEVFVDFKYFSKHNIYIKPKESINFKGKVFLLVDKNVYSAAEMFAVYAKETGFATLIGETTGGDGITNDPALCTLPNCGGVFRFSYVMGTTQSGVCNEEKKTVPHYIVDAEITSDIKDDKCILKAIELVGKEK